MSGKRSTGEGSIHRTKSGRWQIQIMDGYKENGKRNMVSFTGTTRAETLDKLHEFQRQKQESEALSPESPPAPSKVLFSDFADRWYESYRTQVEASTYSNYRYTLAILKNHFGNLLLDEIKATEVNQFINELENQQYSFSQISKCRSMLIQIFDMAEADDLVAKNYARLAFHRTKRANTSKLAHQKDSFTPEEVETLFRDLPEDLMGYSIRLMLVTGLRLQELLALTPADIAEDGSWVQVNKAVKMVDGSPQLGIPKSAKSNRTVPISSKFRYVAVWLRKNGGQAFLWCAPHRESLLYATYTARRQYYCVMAEIPAVRKLSPHCCRHTYVTMLQNRGIPMETIAQLTGHTDIKTTSQYLHISSNSLAQAVTALETAI